MKTGVCFKQKETKVTKRTASLFTLLPPVNALALCFLGCQAFADSSGAPPAAAPGGVAVAAPVSGPAPRVDFQSTTYDFGRAKSGETVKHEFVFTNSGNATLEILDVKTSCGCTTAGSWDKKVEPGKTGIIPLQFNSTGFGGGVSKTATITCNDPVRTNVFLQLNGTVWKPIDVSPQMAMFTVAGDAPTNETKVLRVVNNLDEAITLSDVHCNNSAFKAEVKEVKPGKEFELLVSIAPPFTSPTVFSTITMKTSSTNAPTVSVSAYAAVQQAVTVSPQQVTLPAGPLKGPVNTAVLVRNNTTNAFEVSDFQLGLPGVELKMTQPQTGKLYSIAMSFPAGFQLPKGQVASLTMKSTHPKFPEIKVPIVQIAPVAVTPARSSAPVPTVSMVGAPTLLQAPMPGK